MRFAYADPPYPGCARRYYRHEPTYAGEVDHRELIASLGAANYDGWALSTSAKALRDLLPLCPQEVRVCPWVKPIGVPSTTWGPHNTWEALLVVGGRKRRPGCRDWLSAHPARSGGTLPGRKPVAFCAFLFEQLGMLPGDELVDLFPGTGVVGRAWAEVSRAALSDVSPRAPADGSREPSTRSSNDGFVPVEANDQVESYLDDLVRWHDEASARARSDASEEYSGDMSRRPSATGGAP